NRFGEAKTNIPIGLTNISFTEIEWCNHWPINSHPFTKDKNVMIRRGTYNTNGEKWVYIAVYIAALRAVMCTSAYPYSDKSTALKNLYTTRLGGDIIKSSRSSNPQILLSTLSVLLPRVHCWDVSTLGLLTVVARCLELCPVYNNSFYLYYMGIIIEMVKSDVHYIYSDITRRNVHLCLPLKG
ncbi:hypothetical protein SFRURICE_015960, partial [Spodoptera frugiperda]